MDYKLRVPLDESCELYVKSFNCTEDLQDSIEFFNEYGFVVYNNVYNSSECSNTRNAMWEVMENEYEGLNKDDIYTWNKFQSTGKYGMSMRGACFHPTLVKNRCHPNLNRVLKAIVSEDVMVSQDRYTIFRATRHISESGDIVEFDNYRTGPKNIHLDLNPWWYFDPKSQDDVIRGINTLKYNDTHDFVQENNYVVKDSTMDKCHVQCILNFNDNVDEDGGTILIPKHHQEIQRWCETRDNKLYLKVSAPFLTFEKYTTCTSEKKKAFQKHEYDAHQSLLSMSSRIPMREGSVLMWNQILFHGTAPNRHSTNCRYAQYLKAFPRGNYIDYKRQNKHCLSTYDYQAQHISRLRRRAHALLKELIINRFFESIGATNTMSDLTQHQLLIDQLASDRSVAISQDMSRYYCSFLDENTKHIFGLDLLLIQ